MLLVLKFSEGIWQTGSMKVVTLYSKRLTKRHFPGIKVCKVRHGTNIKMRMTHLFERHFGDLIEKINKQTKFKRIAYIFIIRLSH